MNNTNGTNDHEPVPFEISMIVLCSFLIVVKYLFSFTRSFENNRDKEKGKGLRKKMKAKKKNKKNKRKILRFSRFGLGILSYVTGNGLL